MRTNIGVMQDPREGKPTAKIARLHELLQEYWSKIYNKHKSSPPLWEDFHDFFGQYVVYRAGAPEGPPDARLLWDQAQKAKPHAASGMDGWRPCELRLLPVEAWEQRRKVMGLQQKLGRYPDSTYHVAAPGVEKENRTHFHNPEDVKKLPLPEDYRLLTIFTGIHRIEVGADYRQHVPWLQSFLHPGLIACLPGMEATDAS